MTSASQQRTASSTPTRRGPARVSIPLIVLLAAMGAAIWFFVRDDGTSDQAASPEAQQPAPAEDAPRVPEGIDALPLPDDICAWITPQQLRDAGFAEVSSQNPGTITLDGVANPSCQFVLRPDDPVAVGYSVHQPPDYDPEEMLDWASGEATEIEGLGDAAAIEMSDPQDPESTAFTVAVSVGGQNLVFSGDTRAADQEATLDVVRQLVDQMRAGSPGD